MALEILKVAEDKEKWHLIIQQMPKILQDIYFWPEYVFLSCLDSSSQGLMFVYKTQNMLWLYPFILKPIEKVGHQVINKKWCDIQTAYGYGGPLSNTDDVEFLKNAHNAFDGWCQDHGVICEFIRLHPLLNNHRWLSQAVEIAYDRDTVSVDLFKLLCEETPFNAKTRNMIQRAEKLGVNDYICQGNGEFNQFVECYIKNMDFLNADKYYYFNEKYFSGLKELVKKSGWLITAKVNDEWVGAAIFLRGSNLMHYHLSASDCSNRIPGVMNLLIYKATQIGSQQGLKSLHLGGGRTNLINDSLLEFKRKMANDIHRYYIGKRVHNVEAYQELKEIWRQQCPQLVDKYGNRLMCYHYSNDN